MKSLKFLVPLVLVLSISIVLPCELQHGLGFSAGQISGIGFSYRQMRTSFGFQVTAGFISFKHDTEMSPGHTIPYDRDIWVPSEKIIEEQSIERETHGSAGVNLFLILHKTDKSKFYFLTGVSTFFTHERIKVHEYQYKLYDEAYSYEPTGKSYNESEYDQTLYGGIGLGLELKITENIRFAFEWPLSISDEGDVYMYIPQAGLHYFFK